MKLIAVGKTFAIVDEEDCEKVKKYVWHCGGGRNTDYAQTSLYLKNKRSSIMMHRLIMNANKKEIIDHIDGNGLNNQKSNLRIASYSQNQQNRGPTKVTSSGYKGVYWHKQRQKWKAAITVSGKQHHIGMYLLPEKAALAYNVAARVHHGEFAYQNKITNNKRK